MIRMLLTLCTALIAFPLHANNLEVRGDRLFVSVEVGGKHLNALLDSGAEVTVFDHQVARELRFAGGAAVEARGTGADTVRAELVDHVNIRVLDRDMMIPKAAVIDLSDVGKRLLNAPLRMILGREFFDSGRVLIDIEPFQAATPSFKEGSRLIFLGFLCIA
jgi:hypothetical protein